MSTQKRARGTRLEAPAREQIPTTCSHRVAQEWEVDEIREALVVLGSCAGMALLASACMFLFLL